MMTLITKITGMPLIIIMMQIISSTWQDTESSKISVKLVTHSMFCAWQGFFKQVVWTLETMKAM